MISLTTYGNCIRGFRLEGTERIIFIVKRHWENNQYNYVGLVLEKSGSSCHTDFDKAFRSHPSNRGLWVWGHCGHRSAKCFLPQLHRWEEENDIKVRWLFPENPDGSLPHELMSELRDVFSRKLPLEFSPNAISFEDPGEDFDTDD